LKNKETVDDYFEGIETELSELWMKTVKGKE
jgi:hypothetical protein